MDNLLNLQQASLQNSIVNVESQITALAIKNLRKLVKNEVDFEEFDLVPESDRSLPKNELLLILIAFYGIVMTLKGDEVMNDRALEFDLPGDFSLTDRVKDYIQKVSDKVSQGHIDTISKDLYETARKAALEGKSQQDIISALTTKYSSDITELRAKTVARTETNRAFTRAQFEADQQFIDQNELQGRAFKRWKTRGPNPCDYCLELESEGLIPFEDAFRQLGDEIKIVTDDKINILPVSFETLEAGNAHPNCSCIYELVIK